MLLQNFVMYLPDNFRGHSRKNVQIMIVLGLKCFFCIFGIENFENSKKLFCKGYFIIRLYMFMTKFEVISQKMTELWLFLVLSVFCIFCIEKFEISKKIFSKCYFSILKCTFMTNFETIGKKMTKLWSFQVLSVFCIFCIEKFEISKKIFCKGYFRIR